MEAAKKTEAPQKRCSAEAPYPPIAVASANMYYAKMMKANLASSNSEMTAIMQYQYQRWIFQEKYPKIAEGLHHIAIDEMKHYHIFGELTLKLGGNPSCSSVQNNRNIPWNGTMVNYDKVPARMIKTNLSMETATINLYQQQIKQIKDQNITAILKRMIEDERIHIQLFESYLKELQQ